MTEDMGPRRGRYRGGRWTKVSHGLYRPAQELSGPRQDLDAWRLVLPPSGAFTHLTAAREHGWWLPPLAPDLPVFASMSKHESRPRREGLLISRHDVPVDTVMVDDLPLNAPAETLLACARDLGLLDLVVLIDAALHLKSCTPDDLGLAGAQRRRGAAYVAQSASSRGRAFRVRLGVHASDASLVLRHPRRTAVRGLRQRPLRRTG